MKGDAGSFGGAVFTYNFLTSTANTDPSSGNAKTDNSTILNSTTLFIDYLDSTGANCFNYLNTIDDSTSSIKGTFRISNTANVLEYVYFNITGNHDHVGDPGGWFCVPILGLNSTLSTATFPNNTNTTITFTRTGDRGDQGIQGAQGYQGIQGTQGVQGLANQGVQGSQGIQGIQGDQGTQGYQGTQGIQGLANQGVQGSQGIQGTQGIQGYQGTQSTQGTQGYQGTQGVQGVANQGVQGTQGIQGTQGYQGTQGVQGLANQGVQGTQGLRGQTGIQGNQGVQGSQGGGSQGIQGTQGVQGLANQGVQGSQGIQGAQGTQGTQGVAVQGVQGLSGGLTPRTQSLTTGSTSFAFNSTNYNMVEFTALSNDITISADNGTPENKQECNIIIKDNGTARSITFTTGVTKGFSQVGTVLPTATVAGKWLYVKCIYNSTASRWHAVGVVYEA